MKIRDGFVTNSSSTSFIIFTKSELTSEYLANKLGVTKSSPFYSKIVDLCNDVLYFKEYDIYNEPYSDNNFQIIKEAFGEEVAKKYKKFLKDNYKCYWGSFGQNDKMFDLALALESFVIDDDDFYMDASQCSW